MNPPHKRPVCWTPPRPAGFALRVRRGSETGYTAGRYNVENPVRVKQLAGKGANDVRRPGPLCTGPPGNDRSGVNALRHIPAILLPE
jgi:hypothetical protein